MSGAFQDGFENTQNNNVTVTGSHGQAVKRRRMNDSAEEDPTVPVLVRGRSFLPIHSSRSIFQTQEWKSSGTSLFAPVTNDLYINLTKYDQVSAAQGSFYTADETGSFCKMMMGHVLHLWRFDKTQRKCYISQSFLFTNFQEFMNIQAFLQNV